MGMEAAPAATAGNKKPPPPRSLPLPPALFLVRARSRASRVADLDDGAAAAAARSSSFGPPDTPPRRSPVTVPFLWEEAPGKPKGRTGAPAAPAAGVLPSDAAGAGAPPAAATTPAAGGVDHAAAAAKEARPAPLKLPPRLQRVASARQKRDGGSLSPKAALHGPYYYYGCAGGGGKRPPPKKTASGFAAFRRAPSFGAGIFSRSSKRKDHLSGAAAPPDALWCSPAASSASSMSSSSSSLSASCFRDDHGHEGHRRPADAREDVSSEEDECASRGTVRITRFRRNRSFPSMTTSHLWASIRKNVKQITPWS